MSVDLKNSETLKNLMRAFAGESQARNRYTFAASVCRQQKLHVVEAVFRFTADQEKEHAEIFYNHMKELAGQTVAIDGTYPVDLTNDVKELLRKAQHNEYEEHDPVYKTFGDVAQQEGFSAVAASFHKIAEIEQAHGNRFGRLADLLEQGKLFVSDVQCAWMCLNCGQIIHATMAPTNQWSENPAQRPLSRKMMPFSAMISPMLRQSGTMAIFSFSSGGIFFHADRWECPFPVANTKPPRVKRTPKKMQV